MPRVSDDHLERRRRQILDAARVCFIRKGFHLTSMQDVFAESGLSAGAVYRYFKSKNEIIHAIATDKVGGAIDVLEEILKEDPLPPLEEIVERFATYAQTVLDEDGALRVAPYVWAEGLHDPEYHALVAQLFGGLRSWLTVLATRMRDDGRLPADTDPQAMASTLVCLLPGFILQRLVLGDVDAGTLRKGIRALTGAT
jgi:AcrR family transcriptional regulator